MPQISIDGVLFDATPEQTVIEAAYSRGYEIPHFCWHPELSVSGNCRMCLVEVGMPRRLPDGTFEKDEHGENIVGYFPKLQIACATPVAEGMHIKTKSHAAIKAQEAVMEFLLINHPLDCPICDEAGQCKLQDYAFRHSAGESRYEDEKNHKDKRQSWGPNVLFDAERCISCSRCIRFSKEVAGQDVLSFVERGDHVTIKLFKGTQLDNPYSMNVIDICPVGALTSKDFRFKSRVWEMSFNDSVCPGCARGCNIKIGIRNNEILRIEPSANPYVNKFWMCDYGRLSFYDKINQNRVTEPTLKKDGKQTICSWKDAIAEAAKRLSGFKPSEIMIVSSAAATNEDNFVISKFAKSVLNTNNIDFFKHVDIDFADDFLRVSTLSPNTAGALEIGIVPAFNGVNIENLAHQIHIGEIKALLVINEELSEVPEIFEQLGKLNLLVVLAQNHNPLTEIADIVLAASTFAEVEGTFTNVDNRVQHFEPALVTADNLRSMGMKMSRLDKFGADNDRWTQHEKRKCRPVWKIIRDIAGNMGYLWNYKTADNIFDDIVSNYPSFNDMNYEKLDEHQGLTLGRADEPDPKVINYESHYLKPE